MKSIDSLFDKDYDRNHYNCVHFAADFFKLMYGSDLAEALSCFLVPERIKKTDVKIKDFFKKVSTPENGCIVLMSGLRVLPHIGVFWEGKVLQIRKSGVEFSSLEIATFGFKKIGFYKWLKS